MFSVYLGKSPGYWIHCSLCGHEFMKETQGTVSLYNIEFKWKQHLVFQCSAPPIIRDKDSVTVIVHEEDEEED